MNYIKRMEERYKNIATQKLIDLELQDIEKEISSMEVDLIPKLQELKLLFYNRAYLTSQRKLLVASANPISFDGEFTRTADTNLRNFLRKMFKEIKLYESLFRRDALNIIKTLRKSPKPGPKLLKDASDLFYFNQLKGFNISFAVKDLVEALEKHGHRGKNGCPAAFISFSLKDFAKKNVINKKKLLSILQNVKSKNAPPEINELIKFCK